MNIEYEATDPLYTPISHYRRIQEAKEKSQRWELQSLAEELKRIRQNPKQFGIEYFFLE